MATRRISKGGALDAITNLCKRRGFAFPSSEIYGSIGTAYDLGPLGAQLKKNLQDRWWRDFVERRKECMGLETATILNPRVWEASGHVSNFSDPLTECVTCKKRVRVDKLVDKLAAGGTPRPMANAAGKITLDAFQAWIHSNCVACPACQAKGVVGLGKPRDFNLLFTTHVGPVNEAGATPSAKPQKKGSSDDDEGCSVAYLRPETAQGVYVQFNNIVTSTRARLPFGVAQAGKSFRNEIRTSNFLFRAREFDQWELQYFCAPPTSPATHEQWVAFSYDWLQSIGIRKENIRLHVYQKEELAHYALATTDIEYNFPFGWDELWGIANRGSYDLDCHSAASGVKLKYTDPVTKQEVVPHVIEPALGGTRLLLAVLCDAYAEEAVASTNTDGPADTRIVLKLHEDVAPFKFAVLPLVSKGPLAAYADTLHTDLLQHHRADIDVTGSIGKRYRRHDEIGTPMCVTVDHDTLLNNTVTVRCRDTMKQVRVPASSLMAQSVSRTNLGLVE